MMTSVIILLLCISSPVLANGPFIDEPPQYITGRFTGDTVQFNCSINTTDDYPVLFVRVGSTAIQPDDNYSGVVYHRSSPDTITVNVTITNNNAEQTVICVAVTPISSYDSSTGVIKLST